jgi:hypothetical protein
MSLDFLLLASLKEGAVFGAFDSPSKGLISLLLHCQCDHSSWYSAVMSEVEQELDQHKAIESPREQTTTAEKRNACEPGLDLESNAIILILTS